MAGKGDPFKRPKRNAVIFGKQLAPILDLCDAIVNGEIIEGKSYELIVSDRKIIWKVKKASSTGSGSSSYRGEYSPDGITPLNPGPFLPGDIVRVSPTNADSVPMSGDIIPGVYVCILEGATTADLPNHPLSDGGETAFWNWISTWPSASTQCNGDGTETDTFSDEQPKDPPE